MTTIFVVNADDFGLTEDVNRGIVRAHADGIVTSTSIMTNMPFYEAAVDVRRSHPRLGFGLHLCLSEGSPVLPVDQVRSLVDEQGRFLRRHELFQRVRAGRVDLRHVRAEVEAQAGRLQRIGIHPDHWNSHQYVHLHPQFLQVIESTLSPQNFPCMRTHRRAYIDTSGWMRGLRLAQFYGRLPLRLVKDLYFTLQTRTSRRHGFVLPDAQLTRVPFQAPYSVLAENAPRGAADGVFEWICHPSATRRPEDKDAMDRPGELALLTSGGVREQIAEARVQLATFRDAMLVESR